MTSLTALFLAPSAPRRVQKVLQLRPLPESRSCSLGLESARRRKRGGGSVRVLEAKVEDNAFVMGGNPDLEAEIYEFMQKSSKPSDFPTKAELIAAGRSDLAAAVAAEGGWLALGWDLDEEEAEPNEEFDGGYGREDDRVLQERFGIGSGPPDYLEASSSGRPMEMEGGEDGGIEGILSRLEKERIWSYSLELKGRRGTGQVVQNTGDFDPGGIALVTHKSIVGGEEKSNTSMRSEIGRGNSHDSDSRVLHSQNGTSADVNGTTNLTSDTWRSWGLHMAGFSEADFEAAEIDPSDNRKISEHGILDNVPMENKIHRLAKGAVGDGNGKIESYSDSKQIRMRLQHLESDLTSGLHLLRSRVNSVLSDKGEENSLSELHRFSDAWEFQETKVMKARDQLRSIRAKLAVHEGKMALEIIEAQKVIEEKQKKLEAAQKALRDLRTANIVWPNTASEVLLAGSFDGWTTQRRMERSKEGVFSLHLKLYPGRYEIKFIVDGSWKIDPLRPIVNNNGHENNLLVIS